MGDSLEPRTSPTLLGRLRQPLADADAWSQFVRHYAPRIQGWCRRWGLQEADSDDVAQSVLLKLADKLRSFEYDPTKSFRGWLKTITHHAWRDSIEASKSAVCGSGDTHINERLQTIKARDDLVERLDIEFERELLEEAMARVRLRVSARTFEAFRLLTFEDRSGQDVAVQLGLTIAAAYMAKCRIQGMLRSEIAKLSGLEHE